MTKLRGDGESFSASSSGGGCEWYTKPIQYKGKDAFIAITDDSGLDLPVAIEDSVYVGIYDPESGDLVEEAKLVGSLQEYLESNRIP